MDSTCASNSDIPNPARMKRTHILQVLAICAALSSCTKDFSSVNTDSNVPTSVTPDLLLGGILRSVLTDNVGTAWGIGNLVAQYNAKIQFVNEDRYLWNEQNGVWNNTYANYRNLQNIFITLGNDQKSSYYGVALVLKAYLFERLTATYGDIPYSEAGKAKVDGTYTPKYDKQETLYANIQTLLDNGIENCNAEESTFSPASDDVIYNGNLGKWVSLANALKVTPEGELRVSPESEIRMKAHYEKVVVPALMKQFNFKSSMEVPRFEKMTCRFFQVTVPVQRLGSDSSAFRRSFSLVEK
ncbi:MAG: SusD/RagB family nutrient-binding outer membrane lipoprotein, partial [Chitinophagia bacterium]|nr:SusD/RagB family nutrient-binding outer membrane lipoprotein [Chitinophagia bacterium]